MHAVATLLIVVATISPILMFSTSKYLTSLKLFHSSSSIRFPILNRMVSQKRLFSELTDEAVISNSTPLPQNPININGLKIELQRIVSRTYKKIGKAQERLLLHDTPGSKISSDFPSKESCMEDVEQLTAKLRGLRELESQIQSKPIDLTAIAQKAFELGVSDESQAKQEAQPRTLKNKNKSVVPPRRPFNAYKSCEGIRILVGRSASDNDILSTSTKLRSQRDWWLHVDGCAGSHVVICYDRDDILQVHRSTVLDAAYLAAINSKSSNASRCKVHLTRCGNVKKPADAKPGLVHISGAVEAITIALQAEASRSSYLLPTKDYDILESSYENSES